MRRDTQLTSSARFYERKLKACLRPSEVCTTVCHNQQLIIDEVIPRALQRVLKLADYGYAECLDSEYLSFFYSSCLPLIADRNAPLPYFALLNILTLISHDMPTLSLIQHVFDYCRPPISAGYLAAVVSFVAYLLTVALIFWHFNSSLR